MLNMEEVDERFAHLTMVFKTHYKGSFSYRGENFDYIVEAGMSFDSGDAYHHQVNTDDPPEFDSVDNWDWVKVKNIRTDTVVFESRQERW